MVSNTLLQCYPSKENEGYAQNEICLNVRNTSIRVPTLFHFSPVQKLS